MKLRNGALVAASLLAISTIAPHAFADSPSVTAVLTSSEAALGQPVHLQIQVNGVASVESPRSIDVNGLDIRYSGESQNFALRNFQMSSSITIDYTIMPVKTGTFKIPPQTIRAAGTSLRTPELTLRVVDAGNRAGGGGGGNSSAQPNAPSSSEGKIAFAELIVPKKSAFVGETLPVVIRIGFGTRTRVSNFEPPSIEGQGFTLQKLGKPQQNTERIDGRYYDVLTYKTALSAARTGSFTLGPVEMKALVLVPRRSSGQRHSPFDPFNGEDPFSDPFFTDPFSALAERREITIKSEPVELEVKPLPPGAPATFDGAVGNFSITAEANPKRVQIGDPITIKASISGRGNFDQVNAPKLTDDRGWHKYPPSSNFKQDDDVGISGTKTFEMVVSPNENKSSVPPLEFTYFDPVKERYVTVQSNGLPVAVEGTPQQPPAATSTSPAGAMAQNPPKSTPGILQQIAEPGKLVHTFAPIYTRKEFWFVQLLPLTLAAALAGWRIRRVRQSNRAAIRAEKWQRESDDLVRKLRRADLEPREYFADASRIVQLKTALKENVEPTAVDAEVAARAFALDEEQSDRLRRLFNTSDELRYSGSINGSVSQDRRREALELIEVLRV
ncbi:MAG TPA: BatD family protein [Chthoniobacterales bacterium]